MVTTTKDLEAKPEKAKAEKPEPTEAELAEAAELRKDVPAKQKAKDEDNRDSKMKKMFAVLAEQPKVKIRIRKEMGPQTAIINGARYNIPAGIPVEVPEQVAQLLQDAEII